MEPEAQREASAQAWAGAAAGWARRREQFERAARPVTMRMLDRLDPQAGQRIVELAAGQGETGLLAAEIVAPGGGSVLLTDVAEEMLEGARTRARQLGARNVETKVMGAEWLDLPAAATDGILCRFGLMLLVDPAASVRECRRVLRPGGRLVAATWAAREHNPWATAVTDALTELGLADPPDPGAPGMFALDRPERLTDLLHDGGFAEVTVDPVDLVFDHPDADDLWQARLDQSPSLPQLVESLAPADHYRVRDAVDARLAPWTGADGAVRVPGRALVVAAEA